MEKEDEDYIAIKKENSKYDEQIDHRFCNGICANYELQSKCIESNKLREIKKKCNVSI